MRHFVIPDPKILSLMNIYLQSQLHFNRYYNYRIAQIHGHFGCSWSENCIVFHNIKKNTYTHSLRQKYFWKSFRYFIYFYIGTDKNLKSFRTACFCGLLTCIKYLHEHAITIFLIKKKHNSLLLPEINKKKSNITYHHWDIHCMIILKRRPIPKFSFVNHVFSTNLKTIVLYYYTVT